MKFTKLGFFQTGKFILFLGLSFMSLFNYAEMKNSLSEEPSFEQQMTKMTLPEMSKEKEYLSSQESAFMLKSVKMEALVARQIIFPSIPPIPVLPFSLEWSRPFKKNEKFEYLVLAGGGISYDLNLLYLSADVGFKYNFQPWAVSLTAGGVLSAVSVYFLIREDDEDFINMYHPALDFIKWNFSIGRDIANIHVALIGGSFSLAFFPFLGVSISVPITNFSKKSSKSL